MGSISWVLLAVIAIFLLFGYFGFSRGLIKTVLSVASMIVTLLISVVLTPALGAYIRENTEWDEKLYKSVYTTIVTNERFNAILGDTGTNQIPIRYTAEEQNTAEYTDDIASRTENVLKQMQLPMDLSDGITEVVEKNPLTLIMYNGTTMIKNAIAAAIAMRLVEAIINAMVYMIVFCVVLCILQIVYRMSGWVSNLPVIRKMDKAGGLALGLLEGLIVVWLLMAGITAMGGTAFCAQALVDIGDNPILKFFYQNNLIIKAILAGF